MDAFETDSVGREASGAKSLFVLQLIVAAMTDGVILFGAVVVGLHFFGSFSTAAATDDKLKLLDLMSCVHVVMAGSAAIMAWLVPKALLSQKLRPLAEAIADGIEQVDSPAAFCKFLVVFRLATIIRMAMLEGVAFFGLIICLLGVTGGVMAEHPVYWVNLLSTGLFLLHVALSFPSRHRAEAVFQRKLADSRGTP